MATDLDDNEPVPDTKLRCLMEVLRRIELGTTDASDAQAVRRALERASYIIGDLRRRVHELTDELGARLH